MSRFVPLGVEAEQILATLLEEARRHTYGLRLHETPGRRLLKKHGLIESCKRSPFRTLGVGTVWQWRLTDAGRAEAERIAREPR